MKKNLLTLLFVMAILCGGALAVSAKTSSSPGNSVARLSVAKTISNKIKALKAKCAACEYELQNLITDNFIYEAQCASGNYQVGCAPAAELMLLASAAAYEDCLYWSGELNSKNIDKAKDRNKKQRSNV